MKRRIGILLILFTTIIGNSCSKRILTPQYKTIATPKTKLFSNKVKKIEYKVVKMYVKKRFLFGDKLVIKEKSSKKHPMRNIPCK